MGLLSTLMDLVLHRPRGITGKGMPPGQQQGQFGPLDAQPAPQSTLDPPENQVEAKEMADS